MAKYTFIDLFAGAGGLSEGFIQAGFVPVAHVEMNTFASKTLETRSVYHYLKSTGQLKYYYEYLKGVITRDKFWFQENTNYSTCNPPQTMGSRVGREIRKESNNTLL